MNVKAILEELGYVPCENGEFYRTSALYRGGGNPTAMGVAKDTGWVYDFGRNIQFPLQKLVELTLKYSTEDAEKWLAKNGLDLQVSESKPKVSFVKKYPASCLDRLEKNYSYYTKKGISEETLKTFGGGIARQGKMANRFVFPAYDADGEIVGFAGRYLNDYHYVKWKFLGKKKFTAHHFQLVKDYITKENRVILVESIGDFLALWEAGVRNVLTIFGKAFSDYLFGHVISLNTSQVIVALNNEDDMKPVARRIVNKLSPFYDGNAVISRPPPKNDFGDMSSEEIHKWYKNLEKPQERTILLP